MRSYDHPQAAGRDAQPGEKEWAFYFLTEDGSTMWVHVGQEGHDALRCIFQAEELEHLRAGVGERIN